LIFQLRKLAKAATALFRAVAKLGLPY